MSLVAKPVVGTSVRRHFTATFLPGPMLGSLDKRAANAGSPILLLYKPAFNESDQAGLAVRGIFAQRGFEEPHQPRSIHSEERLIPFRVSEELRDVLFRL